MWMRARLLAWILMHTLITVELSVDSPRIALTVFTMFTASISLRWNVSGSVSLQRNEFKPKKIIFWRFLTSVWNAFFGLLFPFKYIAQWRGSTHMFLAQIQSQSTMLKWKEKKELPFANLLCNFSVTGTCWCFVIHVKSGNSSLYFIFFLCFLHFPLAHFAYCFETNGVPDSMQEHTLLIRQHSIYTALFLFLFSFTINKAYGAALPKISFSVHLSTRRQLSHCCLCNWISCAERRKITSNWIWNPQKEMSYLLVFIFTFLSLAAAFTAGVVCHKPINQLRYYSQSALNAIAKIIFLETIVNKP